MNNKELWEAVLGELELYISKASFITWFKNTTVIDRNSDRIIIGVPNAFTKSWLEQKYHSFILKAVRRVSDNKIQKVVYKIVGYKELDEKPKIETVRVRIKRKIPEGKFNLNPRYRFDNFVVGSSNELAYAASQTIVKAPGDKYNPLFIYGGVGLGKTHLLNAIGNELMKKFPEFNILYTNFEQFTNDYINSTKKGSFLEFRKKYRDVDVLLIDDVQFMVDKEKTQDEFFHTFEALHQLNKQIVITSDRPPKALAPLKERLITRFEWGMIVDIAPPDLEMRISILKSKCKEKGFNLAKDIIEYLARNIKNNIRELEGALNKIISWCELRRERPNLEIVKTICVPLFANPNKGALTPQKIISAVAKFFKASERELIGHSRKKELVIPRQIIMYLMREELNYSYPAIGENLGRDHTTAIHAWNKIQNSIDYDDRLRRDIESIRQILYSL